MATQVLLIDPDIAFMVDVKKALEGTGDFKVSVAANGWAADELLRHGTYAVAVASFGLPDMDFMEMLQRLRQIQPDLPIIATPTAYDDHQRVPLLDVQGSLTRPYKTRDLIPVIESAQQAEVDSPSQGIRRIDPVEPEIDIDHDQPVEPFAAPDMPAGVANLIGVSGDETEDALSPTELLDQVEGHTFNDTTELADTPSRSATGPLQDPASILEEFEELERIQTGALAEDDPSPLPQTSQLAEEFDAMFPSDPFGFDEGLDEVYDPRGTRSLADLPELPESPEPVDQPEEDYTADGTRLFDEIEDPPDSGRLRDLAEAAAHIASSGQLLDDFDDDESDEYGLGEIEIEYPPSTADLQDARPIVPEVDEADLFDEIDLEEPPMTRRLSDMEDLPATKPISPEPAPVDVLDGTTILDPLDDAPDDMDGTKVLDVPEEPPDTTTLLQWDEPEETRRLSGTEALERERKQQERVELDGTSLLNWEEMHKATPSSTDQAVPRTKPLAPRDDEPPRKEGDTPPVPDQDLNGVRQFLATDYSEQDPDDFGAALDAVAHSIEQSGERSPEDRVFTDLVDSLRTPEQEVPRRRRLEELLTSLAADVQRDLSDDSPTSTVDQVLDAVRRGESPLQRPRSAADLDDTTIGDVIDGLFDPSFEGVLAALAGEDIDEAKIDEPTYDEPESLPEGKHGPVIDEPPLDPEDSRQFPATAALTAVAGDDAPAGEFSLDDLLQQIETQLPPARTYRPQLKPLPSWGQSELITGHKDIETLFDHVEGVEPERATLADVIEVQDGVEPTFDDAAEFAAPVDIAPPVDAMARDAAIARDEPDISQDDTLPSAGLLDAMDSVQELDTKPLGLVVPDIYEPTDASPDDLEVSTEVDEPEFAAGEDATVLAVDDLPEPAMLFPGELESEPDFDEDDTTDFPVVEPEEALLSMDDLLAIADLPAEAGTEEIQQEIAQRAAAAAQQDSVEQPGADTAGHEEDYAEFEGDSTGEWAIHDDAIYADARTEPDLPDTLLSSDGIEPDREVHDSQAVVFEPGEEPDFHPEDSQMITLPANKAAELIETEKSPVEEIEAGEEDAIIAGMAVQLTQFALESSAQALLISRPGERLADAGELPDEALDDLFLLVDNAWRNSPPESNSLMRFIALPEVGEFLLYSTLVEHELMLSLVFSSEIPVRTIRRQARRLSESLALVPEIEEPPAAATRPSRPTDLVPPDGWQETLETQGLADDQVSVPVRPDHDDDEPYTAFSCMWLPADPALELLDDLADALERWIDNYADTSGWYLGDLAILSDYILLTLHAPQKMLPDEVVAVLMDETERLMEEHFPLVAKGLPLWTDGYYVVSPPRDLSEREIARFITYQRQAQLG